VNGNNNGTTQISARDLLTVVFRRKVPILLVAVVVAAATLTAASRSVSLFRGSAKILVKRQGPSPLATTWTPFYGLEEEMNTEVEIVRTRPVLERAVEILLDKKVRIHTESGDSIITRDPTVDELAAGVSAEPVEMSNIIVVRYTGSDPEFVAEAVDAVAQAYVEHRVMIRKTSGMEGFFSDQLAVLDERLLGLQEKELALRKEGEIFDLEWQYHVILNRRTEIALDLAETRARRLGVEQKLALAERRLAEDPDVLMPFAEFFSGDLGGKMLLEYWSLRRERDRTASMLTEKNPQVKALDQRLEMMRKRFKEEAKRRIRELEYELEDLVAEENGYEVVIEEISDQLRSTPDVVARILHLEKEIHYTYLHYDKLLEKMLDTMSSEVNDIRISNAKVISPASVQMTGAGRMQSLYIIFSLLLGLGLGVGFGFLLENLDHSVRSASDVEDTIGVPLLGSVPDSRDLSGFTEHLNTRFGQEAK
jgi:uncharacterized protein involved in exopolysaccharide biosynthesis